MKFSVLNCLLFLVAVSVVLLWRIDHSRFQNFLENYDELPPIPGFEEVTGDDVEASVCLADLAFVYLKSDIFINDPTLSLQDLNTVATVESTGRPRLDVIQLIRQRLGFEFTLKFEDATAIDYGESGYYWRINWEVVRSKFGSGGFPSFFQGYVRGDGTRVEPKLFLRDVFGSVYSDEPAIYSVLSFDSLAKVGVNEQSEEDIVYRAEASLTKQLDSLGVHKEFRFVSVVRHEFSGALQQGSGATDRIEVWSVEFVDSSIPAELTNNPAAKIKIFVSGTDTTSSLSVGRWQVGG